VDEKPEDLEAAEKFRKVRSLTVYSLRSCESPDPQRGDCCCLQKKRRKEKTVETKEEKRNRKRREERRREAK
jgi:hypothetical protein